MAFLRFCFDASRWDWYGGGDKTIAPFERCSPAEGNSQTQLLWEIGLIVAVPLMLGFAVAIFFNA